MQLEVRVGAVVEVVGVVDHLFLVERGECHPFRSARERMFWMFSWLDPVEDDAGSCAGVGPVEKTFPGPIRGAELWAKSGCLIPENTMFQEVLRDLVGVWGLVRVGVLQVPDRDEDIRARAPLWDGVVVVHWRRVVAGGSLELFLEGLARWWRR